MWMTGWSQLGKEVGEGSARSSGEQVHDPKAEKSMVCLRTENSLCAENGVEGQAMEASQVRLYVQALVHSTGLTVHVA